MTRLHVHSPSVSWFCAGPYRDCDESVSLNATHKVESDKAVLALHCIFADKATVQIAADAQRRAG